MLAFNINFMATSPLRSIEFNGGRHLDLHSVIQYVQLKDLPRNTEFLYRSWLQVVVKPKAEFNTRFYQGQKFGGGGGAWKEERD